MLKVGDLVVIHYEENFFELNKDGKVGIVLSLSNTLSSDGTHMCQLLMSGEVRLLNSKWLYRLGDLNEECSDEKASA